jgi:hypothetical protein
VQLTAGGLLLVPVALLVEGPPPALDGTLTGQTPARRRPEAVIPIAARSS